MAVRMLKAVAAVLTILSCSTLDFACVSSQPAVATTFDYGGLQRSYRVYQSALYDGNTAFPVLVLLHGMDQTGDAMIPLTHMNTVADQMGFNVIYPDAYNKNWNDGRNVAGIPAYDQNVDDVGFIGAVLDRVKGTLRVDAKRIYVAGISNGAMMAYRLACETPERFAAAATVVGALPVNLAASCSSATPIPIIAFNGTNDGLVLWNGGTIIVNNQDLGDILSVPETIAQWVAINRCNSAAQIVEMPDTAPTDGTRAYRETYTPQTGGADVVFYRIEGAGHTWPGGAFYQLLMGSVCNDIDASALIGTFCLAHTR